MPVSYTSQTTCQGGLLFVALLNCNGRARGVQVQLYFPQFGHPAYGIVRAIAKDSSDYYEGLSSITFLDSDGRVKQILQLTSAIALHISCCTAPMKSLRMLHWEHLSLSQPAKLGI